MVEKLLFKKIGDKYIVWIKNSNKYVQMEKVAFEVIKKWQQGEHIGSISSLISEKYKIPTIESTRFVNEIRESINSLINLPAPKIFSDNVPASNKEITHIYSERFYRFAGSCFHFEFGTSNLEIIIHPLLAHLEIDKTNKADFLIQIYVQQEKICLKSDELFIGEWNLNEEHLFKGRVFMELLNKGYQKKEEEWMAVMHAAAVSNGQNCILIPGESGSGKSTMTAILQAHKFHVLSDDFTPVESISGDVFQFNLAISVKKGAIETIKKYFPEIEKNTEHHFISEKKIVRYLYPSVTENKMASNYSVKAIVFVKYKSGTKLKLKKISKDKAFQIIVTESWISPLYRNAKQFLDWFDSMPCYKLIYSDSSELVTTINQIFNNEL